jgi:hypothetical protein
VQIDSPSMLPLFTSEYDTFHPKDEVGLLCWSVLSQITAEQTDQWSGDGAQISGPRGWPPVP